MDSFFSLVGNLALVVVFVFVVLPLAVHRKWVVVFVILQRDVVDVDHLWGHTDPTRELLNWVAQRLLKAVSERFDRNGVEPMLELLAPDEGQEVDDSLFLQPTA